MTEDQEHSYFVQNIPYINESLSDIMDIYHLFNTIFFSNSQLNVHIWWVSRDSDTNQCILWVTKTPLRFSGIWKPNSIRIRPNHIDFIWETEPVQVISVENNEHNWNLISQWENLQY